MAFATPADLGRYLRRTLTEDEDFWARQQLELSAAAIRGFCRQTFDYVAADSVILQGNWTSVLTLPERPVVSITSVTIATTALTVDSGYTWDGGDKLYRGAREYLHGEGSNPVEPMRHELHWGGPSARVTVVYSHGYQTDYPELLKSISLEMCAVGLSTTPGIKQESLGQYSYTADSPQAGRVTLTADQKRALRTAGFRRG